MGTSNVSMYVSNKAFKFVASVNGKMRTIFLPWEACGIAHVIISRASKKTSKGLEILNSLNKMASFKAGKAYSKLDNTLTLEEFGALKKLLLNNEFVSHRQGQYGYFEYLS
jgi:hypothetical protein